MWLKAGRFIIEEHRVTVITNLAYYLNSIKVTTCSNCYSFCYASNKLYGFSYPYTDANRFSFSRFFIFCSDACKVSFLLRKDVLEKIGSITYLGFDDVTLDRCVSKEFPLVPKTIEKTYPYVCVTNVHHSSRCPFSKDGNLIAPEQWGFNYAYNNKTSFGSNKRNVCLYCKQKNLLKSIFIPFGRFHNYHLGLPKPIRKKRISKKLISVAPTP